MAGKCACAQTCNCCTTTSDSVGVVGTGSVGSCFTPSVRYSADPGNRAKAGSDGAVFADTCISDSTGEPIVPEPDGCLTLPAPCILAVGGDPIEPTAGGCIQLPAFATPEYGCGLSSTEDGTLIADTPTPWPDNDLWGNPFGGTVAGSSAVYCMEDEGLRGVPEHTSFIVKNAGTLVDFLPDYEVVDDGDAYISPDSSSLVVTNPSSNRRLTVAASLSIMVDAGAPPMGAVYARMQVRRDGGGWTTVRELRLPENRLVGAALVRSELQLDADWDTTLDPGDALTLEVRGVVANTSTEVEDPGGAASVQRIRFAMSALGVTV